MAAHFIPVPVQDAADMTSSYCDTQYVKGNLFVRMINMTKSSRPFILIQQSMYKHVMLYLPTGTFFNSMSHEYEEVPYMHHKWIWCRSIRYKYEPWTIYNYQEVRSADGLWFHNSAALSIWKPLLTLCTWVVCCSWSAFGNIIFWETMTKEVIHRLGSCILSNADVQCENDPICPLLFYSAWSQHGLKLIHSWLFCKQSRRAILSIAVNGLMFKSSTAVFLPEQQRWSRQHSRSTSLSVCWMNIPPQ